MNPPITVALLASCSSLLIALAQLLINRKQSRTIEILRASLANQNVGYAEYLKAYLKLQVDGQIQELQAFREMLQTAQLVKDKVRLICEHPDSFPDRKLLQSELLQLRTEMLETFARNHSAFSEQHFRTAHTLKTICKDILTEAAHQESHLAATFSNLMEQLSFRQEEMRNQAYSMIETVSSQLHANTLQINLSTDRS